MQLKGLVRFFTFALILICLYQLSFTWFVRTHEKAMDAKATAWVNKLPKAEQVYPSDKDQQSIGRTKPFSHCFLFIRDQFFDVDIHGCFLNMIMKISCQIILKIKIYFNTILKHIKNI
jgi:hypothetical protein